MNSSSAPYDQMPPPICERDPATIHEWSGQPLVIGMHRFEIPVVQAALSGYSDWPMRTVARRLGAPYTIAEVLIDRFVLDLKDRQKTRHHLLVTDEDHPVGAQLMGSDPADFGPAAQRLVEAGFDVIDINFGCPVKTAMGGCRGGYHLGQPDIALQIVDQVRSVVPAQIPVTVKMRRGIDDSAASRDQFFEIFDGVFARGAAAVTVHGRTVEQKYVGPSNWDFLRSVKQHAGSRTVIGSGDVFTAEACRDMLLCTGVDGVSVARGAIGNPWIFGQAAALLRGQDPPIPSQAEQRRVLEMHLELCQQVYPPHVAFTTMRKFGIKFARQHPENESVRNAFATARSLEAWFEVLGQWYGAAARE